MPRTLLLALIATAMTSAGYKPGGGSRNCVTPDKLCGRPAVDGKNQADAARKESERACVAQ